ncbi:MAG: hypothetical protein QHH04_06105 [Methanolinea sp.]|nr:hypothetical protein [Methanolinea sp.]
MIFPPECKVVGHAKGRPCGERVYFLTKYLLRETNGGMELLGVTTDPLATGMMRPVSETRILAVPEEVTVYPQRVQIHNRARLVELALKSGKRCTVFIGHDEHMTFVLDPDPSAFLKIHVYDILPPRPSLSSTIRELEEAGMFGQLDITFIHTLQDISQVDADVFPCRAAGFSRTLDADPVTRHERVAGCLTGSQLVRECYGEEREIIDICPLRMVREEPFITRCCRKEREGFRTVNGKKGIVVHWGAGPAEIYGAVVSLVQGKGEE